MFPEGVAARLMTSVARPLTLTLSRRGRGDMTCMSTPPDNDGESYPARLPETTASAAMKWSRSASVR